MTPFNPGYYGSDDLRDMGFGAVGRNVMVARNCTFIGLGGRSFENIEIGDNVRIDGYTTIAAASGHLKLGSYIHIGGYCFVSCAGGVTLEDFAGLSQRVSLYSASDDYTGRALTNPTVPREFLNVHTAPIHLGRHVIVGSASIVMPGVAIGEGSAVGAQAMVTKSLPEWGIYVGAPARLLKARSQRLLEKEAALMQSLGQPPA